MFSNALNLLGVKVTLIHAAQGTLIFLAILIDRFRVALRGSILRKEQVRKLHHSLNEQAENVTSY
jgi:simple sugar transport system permease protein/ribose transport system permease protein